MRFGIFDHMERGTGDLAELYDERLRLLERADEAGFWCYHKAEHHFIDLDAAPSSNLFLAAASQRTTQIRLGPLVYLLPFYHPLRLVEEICALDQLCRGRLEIGVGKGISPPEHRLWGLDPDRAMDTFEETFAIVRQGCISAEIEFHGKHHQHSRTPNPMRTHQRRMPGFWYPGNVEYAARHRLSTVVSGPVESLGQAASRYREGLGDAVEDWNPGVDAPVLAVKRHMYLAETDAEAHARVARAYPVYHRNLAALWKQFNVPFPNRDPSFGGDMHAAMAAQDLLIGSPRTVAEHLEQVVDATGTDYLIGAFAWGDLSHEESMASLERFIGEVMPEFAGR